jgi:transposase-like protein
MKKGMGRIRLHVTLDCSAYSLETFILHNIEPGSIIVTDSWRSYNFIDNDQYVHEKTNQSSSKNNESLYGVHLVTSLIKRLILNRNIFKIILMNMYFVSIAESQRALVKNLCVLSSRWLNPPKSPMIKSGGILTQSPNTSQLKLYG